MTIFAILFSFVFSMSSWGAPEMSCDSLKILMDQCVGNVKDACEDTAICLKFRKKFIPYYPGEYTCKKISKIKLRVNQSIYSCEYDWSCISPGEGCSCNSKRLVLDRHCPGMQGFIIPSDRLSFNCTGQRKLVLKRSSSCDKTAIKYRRKCSKNKGYKNIKISTCSALLHKSNFPTLLKEDGAIKANSSGRRSRPFKKGDGQNKAVPIPDIPPKLRPR
ncbi:MAG: hypothetical protein ISR65_07445 [Bacteriovoracaceae bacterium]|nr:hypothetical protein [Bacteriovoracaceae bacterium]